jgi:NAD(P)-dependent dehydrogenase (short-subunit alcohol dehydrogenase family)
MADATRLDGKVAIITGGAGGIGSATARLMAARGARVMIADIAAGRAQELAESLPGGVACGLDLADETSIRTLVATTIRSCGRLDILHNNAAALDPELAPLDGDVEHMQTPVWDRTFTVNLRGAMLMCREALPHLRATGNGAIVNTVSNLALQGHLIQAAYSASKAGLVQLTRSIAASHARQGVRCNAVAPGMTLTPSLLAAFPAELRLLVERETLRDRLGSPEDIAEAVAFLASDAARNITGHVLVSDGGLNSHVPGLDGFRDYLGVRG